jgi:hypothetical protein
MLMYDDDCGHTLGELWKERAVNDIYAFNALKLPAAEHNTNILRNCGIFIICGMIAYGGYLLYDVMQERYKKEEKN